MKDFSQELYRHLCVLIMDSGILTQHYTPAQVNIPLFFSHPKMLYIFYPVDCGAPLFPRNSTNTIVSGTTVGAMATFQCEEGLIPSGPTCTDTETGGQWLPNPADIQCAVSTTTGEDV